MRKYEVNNDEHKKLRFHLDFFKLPSMHIWQIISYKNSIIELIFTRNQSSIKLCQFFFMSGNELAALVVHRRSRQREMKFLMKFDMRQQQRTFLHEIMKERKCTFHSTPITSFEWRIITNSCRRDNCINNVCVAYVVIDTHIAVRQWILVPIAESRFKVSLYAKSKKNGS